MGAGGGIIAPDRILHDMADLWVSLGKQGEGEAGVLRACSMTLVVAADASDDPQAIGETLAALMPEHPSRAIVIRCSAGKEQSLAARVFAQCWMPFGHRQQICCEQIEITASDAGLPDLGAVILPLKVPDLPVMLWCRSARLFQLPAFAHLADIAQKIVVDSAAFGDTSAALKLLSSVVASGRLLADLSWTRLTRWRELIAQIFENRAQLACLARVSEIRITYRAEKTPPTACYLAAWLLDGFGKIGTQPRVEIAAEPGDFTGRLHLVELRSADCKEVVASIALSEEPVAEVKTGDLTSKALLPALNDYSLMREELSIPGRDQTFEGALTRAAKLALP